MDGQTETVAHLRLCHYHPHKSLVVMNVTSQTAAVRSHISHTGILCKNGEMQKVTVNNNQ